MVRAISPKQCGKDTILTVRTVIHVLSRKFTTYGDLLGFRAETGQE